MPETKQLSAPFVREVAGYLRAPTPDSTSRDFLEKLVDDCAAKAGTTFLKLYTPPFEIAPIDKPNRVFVSPDCKLQWHLLSAKEAPFTLYQDYFAGEIPLHYHLNNEEFLLSQVSLQVLIGDRPFDQTDGMLNVYTVQPGTLIGVPRRFPHQTVPLQGRVAALLALSIPAMSWIEGKLDYQTGFELKGWARKEAQPEIVPTQASGNQ